MRTLLLSLFLLLSATNGLQAQTHTWGGSFSGDWSDPLRWIPTSVPNGAGDYPAIDAVAVTPFTVTMDIDVLLDQLDFMTTDAELLVVNRTVTMNGLGQLGPGAGTVVNLTNSDWLGTGTLHNRTDFVARGSCTIDHLLTENLFQALGSSTIGNGVLTLNNISTNSVDFEVTSEGAGFSSRLTIPAGARFDNAGTLRFAIGAGGARTLDGHLRNNGSVFIEQPTTMNAGLLEQQAGTFQVEAGVLLTMAAGRDVDHQGGNITILGDLLQTNSAFTMSGGSVNGLVRKAGGSLDLTNTAGGDFQMQGSTTLTGSLSSAQTVRTTGHSSTGNAVMTIPNSLTNLGTLRLDSSGVAFNSTVTMGTGSAFTNQGAVDIQVAAGGGRTWNGEFLNDGGGSVQMEANTTMNTGPFTNRGAWTIDAGAALTLSSGTTFTQESGDFTNDGSFLHSNGTDRFEGGAFVGTPELRHTDLHLTPTFGTTFSADVTGSSTLTGDVQTNSTLNVLGSSSVGNTTLTPTASLTNHGMLDFGSGGSGFSSTWEGGGTTLENQGTLVTSVGSGGGRTFKGSLNNHGTVSLQAALNTFLDGTVRSLGTWTNDPTSAMTMTTGQGFELVSGTFDVGGGFTHTSGDDTFTSGTLVGEPELRNTNLSLAPTFINPATLLIIGSSTLLSDVPAATQLSLFGSSSLGNHVFTAPLSQTSAGTLILGSVGAGFNATLTASPGATITNSGTIRTEAGAGGTRNFNGDIHNTGSMEFQVPTTHAAGAFTNDGNLAISSGASFTLNTSSAFVQQSGGIANLGSFLHTGNTNTFVSGKMKGMLELRNSTVIFDPSFTDAVDIHVKGTTNFTGGVAAGQDLSLRGSGFIGNQVFNVSVGLSNSGSLRMDSEGAGFNSTLNVSGGPIDNSGLLEATAGVGGQRTITGQFDNTGHVSVVDTSATFNGGTFTNMPGGTVRGNGTYNMSGSTLQNDGTVRPGDDGIGTLNIAGTFTQGSNGALVTELGGLTPDTEHDVLAVSGNATLGGIVRVRPVNGFNLVFGNQFVILTAGSISGTFDQVKLVGANLPMGQGVELVYTATTVTAQVVHTLLESGQQALPVTVAAPSPGLAGQNNTFQISGVYAFNTVDLVFGLAPGTTAIPGCPFDYGIATAMLVGSAPASANGNALVSGLVPASAAGTTGYFQALDVQGCRISEVMTFVFP